MIKIAGTRISVRAVDKHIYICDILGLEGPVLSLYRDRKQSWFYLWCDTNQKSTDRWLLFPVSRPGLVGYFERQLSLRALIAQAQCHWFLDTSNHAPEQDEIDTKTKRDTFRTLRSVALDSIPAEYTPAPDSLFEPEYAPDISLARELTPTSYDVPIDGNWFFSDLDRFSSVYSQLYGFFYSTGPRFVTNLGARLERYLKSPWEGGFSRVNLFAGMEKLPPALHDLRITGMSYASPGQIRIEALQSVGNRISMAVEHFIANETLVLDAEKSINSFLSRAKLNKRNVSALRDEQLGLTRENQEFLNGARRTIVAALDIEKEFAELSSHSPNVIVTSKVIVALVKRVGRLAEFQQSGLIKIISGARQQVP